MSGAGAVTVTDTAYGQIATNSDTSSEVATKTIDTKHIAVTGTEAKVREYFSDIPVLIQVARCESQFRHTLEDGSVLRGKVDSRDTGVMQINAGYHKATALKLGLDLENFSDNMAYARYLYHQQGTKPWSASASCWNRSLASL